MQATDTPASATLIDTAQSIDSSNLNSIDATQNTNKTVASTFMDDLKSAGILSQNATQLPNISECDINYNNTPLHVSIVLNSNTPDKAIYNTAINGFPLYTTTYTHGSNNNINTLLQTPDLTYTANYKTIPSNNGIEFRYADTDELDFSIKRTAPSTVEIATPSGTFPCINFKNDGVPLAARIKRDAEAKKGYEALTQISKTTVKTAIERAKKLHLRG